MPCYSYPAGPVSELIIPISSSDFIRLFTSKVPASKTNIVISVEASDRYAHKQHYVWFKVVPKRLSKRVVCLKCFDDFAGKRGIDYSRNLRVLIFAGRRATFKFQIASRVS